MRTTCFDRRLLMAACVLATGCSVMPREHWQLTQARVAYADPRAILVAPREVTAAADALAAAETARATLEDPALIDHLAYLAKQRAAIAREMARPEHAI
jgi:hypothetical protein